MDLGAPGRASSERESSEHLRETRTARRLVFSGRLLTVYEDDVQLVDGTPAHREVVIHPGAVAIVAIDSDGRVVLVRQWRHAVGRALWELPAGTRDPDEPPRRTAERELAEETGLRATSVRPIGAAPLTPGYSTEVMHFFLATGLTAGPTRRDDDERMDVEHLTHDQVAALLDAGELDVKTIGGLSLAGWWRRTDG
jgi:ADP-ribose pyrophosphatase